MYLMIQFDKAMAGGIYWGGGVLIFFLVFVESFVQILGGMHLVGDKSNLIALATS